MHRRPRNSPLSWRAEVGQTDKIVEAIKRLERRAATDELLREKLLRLEHNVSNVKS